MQRGFAVPEERWGEFKKDRVEGLPTKDIMAKYGISRNCVFSTARRIDSTARR
jgi:hypothetical protein